MKNEKTEDNFIIFSRKAGELTKKDRTEIFYTINNTIGVFLENYKEDNKEE